MARVFGKAIEMGDRSAAEGRKLEWPFFFKATERKKSFQMVLKIFFFHM